MRLLVQGIASGLVNGAVYALLGAGLVLYFRGSRVVNLAHGETFAVTGVVTASLVGGGLPFLMAAAAGTTVSVVGMVAVERVLLEPRLHWPRSTLIVLTLGVALVVRGFILALTNGASYSFAVQMNGPPLRLAGAALSQQGALTIALTMVLGVGLAAFFRRTVYGRAMTATAENPTASAIVGINVGQLRAVSYAMAALLGSIAALLVTPLSFVSFASGIPLVLRGFVAAAVGNMVRVDRAMYGGFALGIVESLIGTYADPLWRIPVVFGLLFPAVVLLLSRDRRFGGAIRA